MIPYLIVAAAMFTAWWLIMMPLIVATVAQDYEFRVRIAMALSNHEFLVGRELVAQCGLPRVTAYVWLDRMEEMGIVQSSPVPEHIPHMKGMRIYWLRSST